MLKTRIVTALVLLAVLLGALFAAPREGWAAFTILILAAATWEWSRFAKAEGGLRIAYFAGTALLAATALAALWQAIPLAFGTVQWTASLAALLFWGLAGPAWLLCTWKPASPWPTLFAGWVVIVPAWLAFLTLRDFSAWLLLSFAAIAWVADIAAYFAGRRFGRHKLAPAISPGKTVEGAVGAVAGVVLYYFAWRAALGASPLAGESWARHLLDQGIVLLGLFVALTGFSIIGDLFESWMKRSVGLKDSSNLLPGHGGVLDRIDALTSTLPLVAAYLAWTGLR